jgi:PAS domain S-box-containing protein
MDFALTAPETYAAFLAGTLAADGFDRCGYEAHPKLPNRFSLHCQSIGNGTHSFLFLGGMLLVVLSAVSAMAAIQNNRKKAAFKEKKLKNQIFALDQHAIVSITSAGRIITYANDKFCKIMEYSPEEILGKSRDIVNSDFHHPDHFDKVWRTAREGKIWHGEICNKSSAGKLYWLESTFVPMLDQNGFLDHCIIIETDITTRKRLEQTSKAAGLIPNVSRIPWVRGSTRWTPAEIALFSMLRRNA